MSIEKQRITSRATLALYSSIVIALIAWAILLLFTRFVPPSSLLNYTIFFAVLGISLTSTLMPFTYLISLWIFAKRLYTVNVRHALRQSVLLSLAIVLNLILRALHSWNIVMAIVLLGVAVIVEILALARK